MSDWKLCITRFEDAPSIRMIAIVPTCAQILKMINHNQLIRQSTNGQLNTTFHGILYYSTRSSEDGNMDPTLFHKILWRWYIRKAQKRIIRIANAAANIRILWFSNRSWNVTQNNVINVRVIIVWLLKPWLQLWLYYAPNKLNKVNASSFRGIQGRGIRISSSPD